MKLILKSFAISFVVIILSVGLCFAESTADYCVNTLNFELPDELAYEVEVDGMFYYYDSPDGFAGGMMAVCVFDEFEYASEDVAAIGESYLRGFVGASEDSALDIMWITSKNGVLGANASCYTDYGAYMNIVVIPKYNGLFTFATMADDSISSVECDACFSEIFESMYYTSAVSIDWLVNEFDALDTDAIHTSAEYIASGDYFLFSMTDIAMDRITWAVLKNSERQQFLDHFCNVVSQLRDSLDKIGYADTLLLSTFKLSDGSAVSLMVNNEYRTDLIA